VIDYIAFGPVWLREEETAILMKHLWQREVLMPDHFTLAIEAYIEKKRIMAS